MQESAAILTDEKPAGKPRVVSINPTLHTALKVLAAQRALTIQELVEGKLSELLSEKATLKEILGQAEDFISGFEDDDVQEGVPALLSKLRAAIQEMEVAQ